MAKRSSSKGELIDTGRNKMSAKRDVQNRSKQMDDVGRSENRRRIAKTKCGPPEQPGDQGDRSRAAVKKR